MSKKRTITIAVDPHTHYIINDDPPPVPIQHKSRVQPTTMASDGEQLNTQLTQESKQSSWATRLLGWQR